MTRVRWHRPPRIDPPALPDARIAVAAPPQVPPSQGLSTWVTLLLPLLSSVSMAAYMIAYQKRAMILLGVGIVLLSVGLTFGVRWQMRSAARRTKDRYRQRYQDHLDEVADAGRELAAVQRDVAVAQHPSPARLWALAHRRRRVWERRPQDPDFLWLRVGVGRGPLAAPLQLNLRADPTVEYEPEALSAAQRVVARHGTVGRQPALIHLGGAGVVSVLGPGAATRAVARALLGQIAVLHAPDDVVLAVCAPDQDAWGWTRWLPHTRDTEGEKTARAQGAADPVPSLVAVDYAGLADLVEREVETARQAAASRTFGRGKGPARRFVLLIDGYDPASAWGRTAAARELLSLAGPESGITVVTLSEDEVREPGRVDVRVRVEGEGSLTLESRAPSLRGPVERATADLPSIELSASTARALAPLVLTEDELHVVEHGLSLTELHGIEDLETVDPSRHWLTPAEDEVLRVPLGISAEGEDLVLDLKESARDGMGPHGLIVGATGSGKSELLRTLVTGLALRHPPELLSLVLVDFKGGATFAGLTELPHVAGLITNLADDLALVDRVRDALTGEQQRRQKLLRDAGNVDSLRDYQIRQAAGGTDAEGRPLEPLPYLLVVVDEFGELLSGRPDFINLFVQIGRVGRSLGIHLLLATQRLDEGRLRGLESHLSYRICLRTFNAAESRAVIGTPDAYRLPPIPGSAYLKVDESVYTRFRVAYVSAPFAGHDDADRETGPALEPVLLGPRVARDPEGPANARDRGRGARPVPAVREPAPPPVLPGPTQMAVAVERLRAFGQAVHQVWLPPLPPAIPLDALLGPVSVHPDRGLQAEVWPERGRLGFPVGVIDLPLRQEQQPLVLDLAQMHPHVALVGAPQSGKSTWLRTLMLSAMLTHTPRELQFSCVDYGGGTLLAFAGAPHTAGVAGRHEPERSLRVLLDARRLIDQRELYFREHAIASVADFRAARDRGELDPDLRAADLCVVADNWGAVRAELENADALALEIAGRGPGVGVHLVLTANRWGDIRTNLRDAVGARLELRLNDSAESEIDRRAARAVPAGTPGRGAVPPGHLFHAVLPRLDGRDTVEGLGDAQAEAIVKIAAAWSGPAAPRLRVLPNRISVAELAGPSPQGSARMGAGSGNGSGVGKGTVIGLAEHDLEPVRLDLTGTDPHCLVLGDAGSGKSTFLRTWMRGLAARRSPHEARFMVVDYRRSLMDVVPEPYVGAYAADAGTAQTYAAQLAETLTARLPPASVTAEELRERSWWAGPELYLVVDDYDLITGTRTSPLLGLAALLPQGREIGFHVVLSRRSGGIGRALASDPMIAPLRDLGAAGLLLSCDPREGVLLADRRGRILPPGRAQLVRRQGANGLVQIAVSDDERPNPSEGE